MARTITISLSQERIENISRKLNASSPSDEEIRVFIYDFLDGAKK